ncbi:MAG: N-6 DNA methylase [Flavobacterium sp.]|jgi:type I restriction enzyme M protein|uniref:N-6 DNA methylase n=1 Tax=Flavobacterium sp. TaxID=239 RepID=UPI003BA6E5BF
MPIKNFISAIGFKPKENTSGIFIKLFSDGYCIEIDFEKEIINYGNKIICESKTSQNFSQSENFVVLECVNRLLEKGYKPENITLEKTWNAGHGTSGRLDICVTRDDGSEYLLIECKTYGSAFEKEFARMKKDGGQLFTYFKFSNKADLIMLYASELNGSDIIFRNEIVKIEDDYRTGDVKDFFEKWNKLTKDNGIFENWVNPYNFESKALTINDLEEIKQEDSSFIFNRFLEILRHNVVSDKGNAFNRIFTLFLCKIYDEKDKEDSHKELEFQWFESPFTYEGVYYEKDTHVTFQIRLTDLYKKGMKAFLEKNVTDFSETEFNNRYSFLTEEQRNPILQEFRKVRLEKNNEFAIKDVYDEQSFYDNAIVVKEIVELLQGYKLRYTKKQQYLSDFFELLLTTGLKQESGQFFTPVPVAQFVIKSLPIDKIIKEKLHQGEKDEYLPYVIDYAAGSGHFLTETMHEVQRIIDNNEFNDIKAEVKRFIKQAKEYHFDWAFDYVYGIEKDYRLVKVGKVGCYLHGDGLANVIHSDGLANFEHKDYKGKLAVKDKNFKQENKQFDIIISNPPYSVSAFKNAARQFYKDDDFELYDKLTDNSSEIECLFIERTKQLLKDGGVAGIILPSSILSNTGIYSKSREIILQYFDIVGITELGSNTFMATGTNTVTLFLRRRNNYESKNLKIAIEKFFTDFQDVTLNTVEKPFSKYVHYVWEGISFDDYTSLLKKESNKKIEEHELFKEYCKKNKSYSLIQFLKQEIEDPKNIELIEKLEEKKEKAEKDFWNNILENEKEKLLYFIIAHPQKVVVVKSGEKDAEKRFLGYEFSNRRGSEGIHPIQRGKNIEDCTQLFDPEVFDNPTKASTYIYKAFAGDYDFAIDEALQNNVSRHNLVDMLTFDRVEFEKNISLSVKKKVKIESRWELKRFDEAAQIIRGVTYSKGDQTSDRTDKIILTADNITLNGSLEIKKEVFLNNDFEISNDKKLAKNDIFICFSSGSKEHLGKVAFIEKNTEYFAGGFMGIIRVNSNNEPKYFFQLLNTILRQTIRDVGSGSNINNLSGIINEVKIPLPPLDIQQKIVAEIEVLEAKEKRAKEEIESLKNSIDSLFITTNTSSLKNLLIDINPSKSEAVKHSDDSNVSFLSMADVSNEGQIINLQTKKLKEVKSGFTFFQENDVLVAKITPCTENGKGALVPKLENNIGFGSTEFFVLRTDQEKLLPKILFYFTQSKDFRINAEKEMTGTSGHRRVPKSFIENYEIPITSISEQQKIVSEIEKIEQKISALQKEIDEIPKQKEAILKNYL